MKNRKLPLAIAAAAALTFGGAAAHAQTNLVKTPAPMAQALPDGMMNLPPPGASPTMGGAVGVPVLATSSSVEGLSMNAPALGAQGVPVAAPAITGGVQGAPMNQRAMVQPGLPALGGMPAPLAMSPPVTIEEITRLRAEKGRLELVKDITKLKAEIRTSETPKMPPSMPSFPAMGGNVMQQGGSASLPLPGQSMRPGFPVGMGRGGPNVAKNFKPSADISDAASMKNSVTLIAVYGSPRNLTAEFNTNKGKEVLREGAKLASGETIVHVSPNFVTLSDGKKGSRRVTLSSATTKFGQEYSPAPDVIGAAIQPPSSESSFGPPGAKGMPPIVPYSPTDLLGNNRDLGSTGNPPSMMGAPAMATPAGQVQESGGL